MNARWLRFGMNLWSPFRATGIRVKYIAPDYREAEVELSLSWHNRNYPAGTHFGGSLYAMTDPFYALMLMHVLGHGYVVSHQAGTIEYLIPEKGKVHARFALDDAVITDIKAHTAEGQKYLPQLPVEIKNETDDVVARVVHTLHIRRRRT